MRVVLEVKDNIRKTKGRLFEGSLACAVAQTKLPSFFKRERTSFSEGKSFVGSIVIL